MIFSSWKPFLLVTPPLSPLEARRGLERFRDFFGGRISNFEKPSAGCSTVRRRAPSSIPAQREGTHTGFNLLHEQPGVAGGVPREW